MISANKITWLVYVFLVSMIFGGCTPRGKNKTFKIPNYSDDKSTYTKNVNVIKASDVVSFIAVVPYNKDLTIVLNDTLSYTWNSKHISSPVNLSQIGVYDTYWTPSKRCFSFPINNGNSTIKVSSEGEVDLYYYGRPGAIEDAPQANLSYEFEFSPTGLPVFQINTCDSSIKDDPKIPMTFNVCKPADYAFENQILQDSGLIEIRGYTSKKFGKQSYSIKCRDNNTLQKNISNQLQDKIVLYGPFVDLSLIRNKLAFGIYKSMGGVAPDMYPVDLIINNQYRGLYYVMEKAKVAGFGENKLLNNKNINGGYLLEIDRGSLEPDSVLKKSIYNTNTYFDLRTPKSTEVNNGVKKLIIDKFNARELEIYNGAKCSDYFDYYSFVDLVIINELTKNIDAYRLSTFIKDTCLSCKENKYVSGPIWDFNLAFGLANYNNGDTEHGFVIQEQEHIPFWWKKMFAEKSFQEKLVVRYTQLRDDLLSLENLTALIDKLHLEIKSASIQNDKKWRVYNREEFYPHRSPAKSLEEETAKLSIWLENRLNWLDKKWLK